MLAAPELESTDHALSVPSPHYIENLCIDLFRDSKDAEVVLDDATVYQKLILAWLQF